MNNAGRSDDSNPDLSIIADIMKLIGNSAYGPMLLDKTKHRDIRYCQGENNAYMRVNSPQFRQMTCIDEDEFYEIENMRDIERT